MRGMLLSTFAFAGLVACTSTDQSTAPSLADESDPSLARGGRSSVERPLSGHCATVVTRLVPPRSKYSASSTPASYPTSGSPTPSLLRPST